MKTTISQCFIISIIFVSILTINSYVVERQDDDDDDYVEFSATPPPFCPAGVICWDEKGDSVPRNESEMENVKCYYCPTEYVPVCGVDDKTYRNECILKCKDIERYYEGECKSACECTKEFKPQCGVDGKSYVSPCILKCNNVEFASDGQCNSS